MAGAVTLAMRNKAQITTLDRYSRLFAIKLLAMKTVI